MRLTGCVLLWGAFAVTAVWGDAKDCLLSSFLNSSIYDSTFDTSSLQNSYTSGRQIRVNCVVGHSGFFKLICDDGLWKHRGSKCQPKPCGHPGEAQFADFQLVGKDFVFGSKVIYTCNKGYQMVSRINYRRCVSEGWDGVVPVCEPRQCTLPRLDDGVLVTGNLEEAKFGNVLRFSCKSNTQILEGPSEIFCDETGQWSGNFPSCKDVSCKAPIIENGRVVGDDLVYPEDHVLKFQCDPKFQPSETRSPKCTKMGLKADWSPTPACQPIRCKLDLSGTIGATYVPSFTSDFSIGQSVTITCEDDYWIINSRTTSAVSTCQDDGKWSLAPKCLLVTCLNHKHKDMSWWAVYGSRWFGHGSQVRYQCRHGLYPTNDESKVTCTRDGWKPDPPCEERTCDVADVQNAEPYYRVTKVNYEEDTTFKCWRNRWIYFILTCTRDGWKGSHPCLVENTQPREDTPITTPAPPTCPNPKLKNGFAVRTVGQVVYFTCNHGFKLLSGASWGTAECVNSVWVGLEPCIDRMVCGEVPDVPNADVEVTMGVGGHQDITLVTCRDSSNGATSHLSCLDGAWDSNGIPLQNICPIRAKPCGPPPQVKDAIITTPYQAVYQSQSQVTYRCRGKFTLEGPDQIQCSDGKWDSSDIKCTALCFKPKEEQPTMTFHPDQDRYIQGAVLEYRCITPGDKIGGSATCDQGSWSEPISCEEAKSCGPPENMTNGYYKMMQDSENMVQYFCNEGFKMVSRVDTRTCLEGKWSGMVPLCEVSTCDLPSLDKSTTVDGLPAAEVSVTPGHGLHFSCELPGKVLNGNADLFCQADGSWNDKVPTCEDVSCALGKMDPHLRVPGITNGQDTVRYGQKVRFECDDGFFVDGAEEIKCLASGEWNAPVPSCSEPCKIGDIDADIQLESHQLDVPVRKGDKVKFRCRIRSHNLRGEKEVECLSGGQWSAPFPTCGATSAGAEKCLSPPTLTDGDVKDSLKSEYQHLEKVEMVCQAYYVRDGSPMKTCINGKWQGDVKCLKPCTVDRSLMNKRYITFRYTSDDKLYSEHNDEIEFRCTRGRPHGNLRQRCIDGHMDLPVCN